MCGSAEFCSAQQSAKGPTEFERFRGPTIKYSNGGASCPKSGLGNLPCNAIPMYRLEKGPKKKVDPTVIMYDQVLEFGLRLSI